MSNGKVITSDNLTKRFGDFTAVDHISFEVQKGEIFGFLGANGAGKTTFFNGITGIYPVSSGSMTFAGYKFKWIAVGPARKTSARNLPARRSLKSFGNKSLPRPTEVPTSLIFGKRF